MNDFAVEFATRAHAGQTRKGSDRAYIRHPIAVAEMLATLYGRDPLTTAGLLHDVVEDTPITISSIEAIFGPEVAQLVWGVTKTRPGYALPVGESQHAGAGPVWTQTDRDILRLKAADLTSNIRDTKVDVEHGRFVWGHFARGRGKLGVWSKEIGHVGLLLKAADARYRDADRKLIYELRDLYEVVHGLSTIVTDEEKAFLATLPEGQLALGQTV